MLLWPGAEIGQERDTKHDCSQTACTGMAGFPGLITIPPNLSLLRIPTQRYTHGGIQEDCSFSFKQGEEPLENHCIGPEYIMRWIRKHLQP